MFPQFPQHRPDYQARSDASRADRVANNATRDVGDLQKQVDRLTLACQAMWEILRDSGVFHEDDLQRKMLDIDLRDGKPDGKISRQLVDCPSCGAKATSRRQFCVMCGTMLDKTHAFEG